MYRAYLDNKYVQRFEVRCLSMLLVFNSVFRNANLFSQKEESYTPFCSVGAVMRMRCKKSAPLYETKCTSLFAKENKKKKVRNGKETKEQRKPDRRIRTEFSVVR